MLVIQYALAMLGAILVMFVLGLTLMVSRYAKRHPGDPLGRPWTAWLFSTAKRWQPNRFDIYFWCGVIASWAVLWLAVATYT